jgi:hypothetical protein
MRTRRHMRTSSFPPPLAPPPGLGRTFRGNLAAQGEGRVPKGGWWSFAPPPSFESFHLLNGSPFACPAHGPIAACPGGGAVPPDPVRSACADDETSQPRTSSRKWVERFVQGRRGSEASPPPLEFLSPLSATDSPLGRVLPCGEGGKGGEVQTARPVLVGAQRAHAMQSGRRFQRPIPVTRQS